jgi:enoyl-CoA hydratase
MPRLEVKAKRRFITMPYTTLTLSVADHIAHIQLCRPGELNTMNAAFWTEMVEVFSDIDANADVRAVVISALGKHFTAGLDLAMAAADFTATQEDAGRAREYLRRKILRMQESFSVIDRCRVPVIAAIQGGCIGGGVDLVTACDMRIGTENCFFTIQEINVGIVADVGTLQRIPYLLPQGLVRELAYTGRRFTADEALRTGFINRVEADQASAVNAAMTLAKEIASKSPLVITGIKQVLNRGRDQSIEAGLDYVATWNAGMLMSNDLQEAVTATIQKRNASFANLNNA